MARFVLLPALALSLAAAAASAQEAVRLRAGEFSSFSRVTLPLPEGGAWRVEQDGRSFTLILEGRSVDVDSSVIFPDRRVSRVLRASSETVQGGTRITFSLSCDCVADVYALRDALAVDFRDQAAETPPAASQARAQTPAAPPPAPRAAAPAPAAAPEPAPQAARTEPERIPPRATPESVASRTPSTPPADAAERQTPAPLPEPPSAQRAAQNPQDEVAAVVAEAQRRLLEQLSRAAEEGLVEFSRPQEPPPGDPAPRAAQDDPHGDAQGHETGQDAHAADAPPHGAEAAADAHDAAPSGGDPLAEALASGQVEIRSVFERDRPKRPAPVDPRCIDDARFALPVREAAEDPPVAIAAARSELTDASDQLDRAAMARFAKLYVALGFGAEAEAVLDSVDPPLQSAPLVRDLARIVDREEMTPDGPMSSQAGCPGLASVWRMAAPGADGAEIAAGEAPAEALAEALAQIAPPLRHHLGAAVLTAMVDAGRLEAARRVAAVMDRAPGPRTDARRLAAAKFAAAEGRNAQADSILAELSFNSSPEAAEATAMLIERRLAAGAPVERRLVEAAAARSLAHRGTPLGKRLKAAEIRARGNGRFIEALDVLEEEFRRQGDDDHSLREVAQELFYAAMPARVGEVAYAGAVIARQGMMGEDADADPARAATAERLTGLGLANAAIDMARPGLARSADLRLAAARAHVALGEGDAALDLLDGAAGPEAEETRLSALIAAGRHEEAWRAAAAETGLGAESRAELAWRAADWSAAAALAPASPRAVFAAWASAEPADQAAAALPDLPPERLVAMGPPPEEEKPSLDGARTLIERSKLAVTFIEEAMQDG